MKLKVLVRSETVGGYSVSVPALPGCHSQGDTLEEALDNVREAAELWLEAVEARARAESRYHANKDLKPGTQHGIMKDAGLTEDDL